MFTVYSAFAIWGVEGWIDNPDVTLRSRSRYNATRLAPVTLGGQTVPGVAARQTRARCLMDTPMARAGARVDGLGATAIAFARHRHILEAVVAVSGILRALTQVDRWTLRRERDLAEPFRKVLLDRLSAAAGLPGVSQALRVIRFADAACESVGERALLWVVLGICPEMPRTQFEAIDDRGSLFIDIAFPGLRLAFEFDGVGRMGNDAAQFSREKRRMMDRDNRLRMLGWTVVHVTWSDFSDVEALRESLIRRFGWDGTAVEPDRLRLWQPVPAELTDPVRRLGCSAASRRVLS